LALTTDKKVFGWGDSECGQIGRLLKTRDKNKQALKIEAVGAKDAVDIFCGNYHSFYQNSKGQVYAWGLN
jgi:alpha-tubulin suppressor-like RCC1 family protein